MPFQCCSPRTRLWLIRGLALLALTLAVVMWLVF